MTLSDVEFQRRLAPYVPRVVSDWLASSPNSRHKSITGTCLFADIAGSTALTERLAQQGKVGAELTGDLLNLVFEPLLAAAYEYGAHLLKLAGDGALLFFDGEQSTARAARAAWVMLARLRGVGTLRVGSWATRLEMSVGIHSGCFDFMLLGPIHRELLIVGPAASATAATESRATAGTVLLSAAAAAELPSRCLGIASEGVVPLVAPPRLRAAAPAMQRDLTGDLQSAISPALRDHLLNIDSDYEHRMVAVAFIEVTGTDELIETHGVDAAVDALSYVVDLAQRTAADTGVTYLSSDLQQDGTKLLLVAGAPRSHGDDETRMLSTVRRIVRPGGRLVLRAGLTRGRVFAGDYGPDHRRTYSVIGDAVNLAARLAHAAQPGQVLAQPDVVERSKTEFVTTPVPPFRVKGKTAPVHALTVGDVRPRGVDPIREPEALLGRDGELARLDELLEAARRGTGQAVEIVGPAGIGKSSLTAALAAHAAERGVRVLWTSGDLYQRVTSYQPMHGLLRRTMGFPESARPQRIAAVLLELARGSAPHLLPWMPLVGRVANAAIPDSPQVAALEPVEQKARLEAVTSELLGRTLTRPTMLVLHDAHDMDELTRDLIRQLVADVAPRPWLIVITRRSQTPELLGPEDGLRLELGPLDDATAAALLARAAGPAAIGPAVLATAAGRAEGNPLFLEAIAASIAAGEDLDALPESIEGVLAARIDRLPPPQRRLLRTAAVVGESMALSLLSDVVGDDTTSVDVSELSDFVVADDTGHLRFAHGLIRLAAYEGLPFRTRTALHARVARTIESAAATRVDEVATTLSMHYLLGEAFEPAWRLSCRAAELARSGAALPQAVECYRRALVAAGHLDGLADGEVAAIWLALAEVHADLAELADSEHALRQARRLLRGDPLRLAGVHLTTARHREAGGAYSDALRWISRGRRLLDRLEDETALRLRAELADSYAQVRYRQGDLASAARWASRARGEALASGDALVAARAEEIITLVAAASGRSWDPATFHAALERYDAAGERAAAARAHNRLGAALYLAASWEAAAEQFAAAEDAYRALGREADASTNAVNRAAICIDQGRPDDAAAILEAVMPAWLATNSESFLALGHLLLGRIELARANPAAAQAHFTRCAELTPNPAVEGWLDECARQLGVARDIDANDTG